MSKIKELYRDIRALNKKYKCLPIIIFAIIYIASPIDLLPELFYKSWLFYLDDMAVLIFCCIITYMEVFSDERNNRSYERVEGVYSAVRRNPVELGSRRVVDVISSSGGHDVHGAFINELPAVKFPAADSPPAEPGPVAAEPEQFILGPAQTGHSAADGSGNFYEQHIIADASTTNDWVRQASEQSRPESFIIDDGNAIIW